MADVEDASWADGTSASDGARESFELVDLTKVRKHVRELTEAGHHEQALQLLEQLSRWPDSTRYLEDNIWLYGRLGSLYQVLERDEEAIDAFARGFELDPRELTILRPYSELLFEHDRFEEGLQVIQSLLLHHKRELPAKDLVVIYQRLGSFYEGLEEYEKARTAYEKALEQIPGDQAALTGLLRVVAAVAEPLDVIRVRQKLVRSLTNARARSMALVALGNDWVNEFNDWGRALDIYEQALAEDAENKIALERIATIGREVGDWRRVSRAYFTLSQLAEDPSEQADWIIKSSTVARDELWEADKALTGFKKALELDPTRLDAFKAVTSLLVDSKNWEELEGAYVNLITANVEAGNNDPNLMAVLWQKLGDLYHLHLNRDGDAIFAYSQASERVPANYGLHASVAKLSEANAEYYEVAIEHLRAMRQLDPNKLDTLDRMGRVYLRMKQVDKAYCVYRALAHLGYDLDEKAKQFVARLDTAMFRPINKQFTPALLKQNVFPSYMDTRLNDVFAAVKPGLEEWAGESHSKYGLRRRDRVKLHEPLAFNTIYKSVGDSLGYKSLPELWHKPEQEELINGALVPEGLIAGDGLLGSGREEYMAFIVAKQLFLFLQPFYLAAIRPPTDLQIFYILGAAHAKPELNLDLPKNSESAMKALKKRLKGRDYDALRTAYARMPHQADVGTWVESVEDAANRIGLIFSDDLAACREVLNNEPRKIGTRSVDQRMKALIDYAVSDQYFELRERLEITIG